MTRLREENERLRRQLAQVVTTLNQNPNNTQVHDSPADQEDLTRSRTPPKSNLRGLGKGIGKRQADENSSSPDRAFITAAPGLSGEDQVTVSSPSKQEQQQKAASSSPAPDEAQDGMQQVQEDNIPRSSSALSDETRHGSAPAAFNHRSSKSSPRRDVDDKTGLDQSCAPTADHHQQKEEENKTQPPKKMQKTAAATLPSIKPVQQNNPHKEAEMSEPPTVVRKARVSVRARCETPTVSSSFSKHNIPRSSSKA
jgi:hypothetical protein